MHYARSERAYPRGLSELHYPEGCYGRRVLSSGALL
jgi:hypothetical protein